MLNEIQKSIAALMLCNPIDIIQLDIGTKTFQRGGAKYSFKMQINGVVEHDSISFLHTIESYKNQSY